MRLFEDRTARRVGDTVVIRLIESTAASKSATTNVNKSSNINLENPILFGASLGNPRSPKVKTIYATTIAGERELGGEGASDQSNSLTGNVSAVVVGVYPNGNLAIRGEKMLTLNQGEEVVQISGVIRPEDVLANNTILSSQVADAKITYAGNGCIGRRQHGQLVGPVLPQSVMAVLREALAMFRLLSLLLLLFLLATPSALADRIKDLAVISGVRTNQLIGYGLVVGLNGTGDQTTQTPLRSKA
jgi:flagellar basal body L-ring protein FlgH